MADRKRAFGHPSIRAVDVRVLICAMAAMKNGLLKILNKNSKFKLVGGSHVDEAIEIPDKGARTRVHCSARSLSAAVPVSFFINLGFQCSTKNRRSTSLDFQELKSILNDSTAIRQTKLGSKANERGLSRLTLKELLLPSYFKMEILCLSSGKSGWPKNFLKTLANEEHCTISCVNEGRC